MPLQLPDQTHLADAGIQRDLQVFERLDLYGLSVITAVTSQNTRIFTGQSFTGLDSLQQSSAMICINQSALRQILQMQTLSRKYARVFWLVTAVMTDNP